MFLLKDDFWKVKRAKEKGFGVFAQKQIRKGTVIGDYLGKVIKTRDYNLDNDKKGLFLTYYTDEASIYPNLKKAGIHLVNHACYPNCWIYIYKYHTLFFALRKINPGEELTISYLLSPKDSCKKCTHICKCGGRRCLGTMHLSEAKYKLWQEFQKSRKKNSLKPKVIYNKYLPKLPSYPKILPNDPIYEVINDMSKL